MSKESQIAPAPAQQEDSNPSPSASACPNKNRLPGRRPRRRAWRRRRRPSSCAWRRCRRCPRSRQSRRRSRRRCCWPRTRATAWRRGRSSEMQGLGQFVSRDGDAITAMQSMQLAHRRELKHRAKREGAARTASKSDSSLRARLPPRLAPPPSLSLLLLPPLSLSLPPSSCDDEAQGSTKLRRAQLRPARLVPVVAGAVVSREVETTARMVRFAGGG